jgi:hypothetical protein
MGFKWGFKGKWRLPLPWRGVTTTMKRGEVEAPSRGRCTPRGCCPLSYLKGGAPLLLPPWVPLPFPLLLLHRHGECLAKLCQNSSPPACGGVPADPYSPCPAGTRAWRSSPSHTCDRARKRCPLWRLASRSWDLRVIDYIFIDNVCAGT